ncbi:MAG: hypothetical protein MUP47_08435 [Phycisphaerae bacterium]|nr:hypothetical protein [Phycisphaerae bacterium]
MAYDPQWTHGDQDGRLTAGADTVHLIDPQEVAQAINRRRLLTYQAAQDFSSHLHSGAPVRASTIDTAGPPPFHNLRTALTVAVLIPPAGSMGGDPATPTSMDWLWPIDDGDADKRLVSGLSAPGPDEVGLVCKINGTNNWTDGSLVPGVTGVRAVHLNELRMAVEYIRRGRWELPIYWMSGLFSLVPDTPWTAGLVAHTITGELRNVGYAVFRGDQSPPWGLTNITVRPSSFLEVTADADCTVEVFHCLRPMDFWNWPATWNEYNPGTSSAWASPGGTGLGDSVSLGTVELEADVPGQITGSAVLGGFQAIADGQQQNFLIRRVDVEWLSVAVAARAVVEFDLSAPPN